VGNTDSICQHRRRRLPHMRDWRSGNQFDTRTLRQLDGFRLVVTCGWCRRMVYIAPWTLVPKQPGSKHWRMLQTRFRCIGCDRKSATVRVEPIPIATRPGSRLGGQG